MMEYEAEFGVKITEAESLDKGIIAEFLDFDSSTNNQSGPLSMHNAIGPKLSARVENMQQLLLRSYMKNR